MTIITPFQNSVLKRFGHVKDAGQFYFTGGTALSLFYLQHRRSEDLDFFTDVEELMIPFSRLLTEDLIAAGYQVVVQRSFNSFTELNVTKGDESVIIHLALDTPFRLAPFQEFANYPGLKVGSLVDISANKLTALFGRAALRDFIDVYYLVNKGKFSKQQLIEFAKQKDLGFDLYWLGVAFERLKLYQQKDYELSMTFTPLKAEELLAFFETWRKEIIQKLS